MCTYSPRRTLKIQSSMGSFLCRGEFECVRQSLSPSGNCSKHWKGLFSIGSCLLHLRFFPCSLLNITLYIYYELYNKNVVIFSPQFCIQRLSGLRLLHGGHSDGVQWTFCPQRRSQLSVGGLHWKNPLPSSRNSEFHALMN